MGGKSRNKFLTALSQELFVKTKQLPKNLATLALIF